MSETEGIRPIAVAWQYYRLTRISEHAGESELRAHGTSYLHGARAAFGILYALLSEVDDVDQVSDALEAVGADLGLDDPDSVSLVGP